MKSVCIGTLLLTSLAHLPVAFGLTLPSSLGQPASPMQLSRRLALSSLSTAALTLLAPTVALADDSGGAKKQRQFQR